MKRSLIVRAAVLTAVAAVGLTACGGGGGNPLANGGSGGSTAAAGNKIVIGSANFTESQLLAEVYGQALTAKGIQVQQKPPIGSREAYYKALQDGSIDMVPEYTGTLLQYLNKDAPESEHEAVYTALQKTLPATLTVTAKSAAEDKDAIVVTKETAAKYSAKSISDLAPNCGQLIFGGPPEIQKRPDGIPGFAKNYNCTFKEFRALDAGGPLTIAALKNGDVQAADIFTTDASIPQDGFVVLDDPKSNFAAQNVVPLITKSKATDAVKAALDAVSAKLTTSDLTDLNAAAAAPSKPNLATVAKDWLTKKGLV